MWLAGGTGDAVAPHRQGEGRPFFNAVEYHRFLLAVVSHTLTFMYTRTDGGLRVTNADTLK